MDTLNAMQTFVRVAEAGSFTAVADQLQVARSAITRQIVALEKHLAVKLITRSTRSLTLTTAGAAYLEKCRVILNLEGRGLITRTRRNKDGRLVLVKLTAKGRKMMLKLFPEFNKGEQLAVADLKRSDLGSFADLLRAVTITVDSQKLIKH